MRALLEERRYLTVFVLNTSEYAACAGESRAQERLQKHLRKKGRNGHRNFILHGISGANVMAAAAPAKPAAPALPVADASAERWARVDPLPCLLTIEISVPGFTVADLVNLQRGRIIASRWTVGQDVPLRINGALIAWSEFEVVQNRLAVRLTELA